MPYLTLSFTDTSGTTHPQACVVLTNLRYQLIPPAGEVEVTIYHDAAAYQNQLTPVSPPTMTAISPDEINSLNAQFAAAVYGLLQQRPQFAGSQIVM